MSDINWDEFDKQPFVRLEAGRSKTLRVKDVKKDITVIEGKEIPCLVFTVTEEDGVSVNKTWTVTSKKFIRDKLKALVQDSLIFQKKVKITKIGEKFAVEYNIEFVN